MRDYYKVGQYRVGVYVPIMLAVEVAVVVFLYWLLVR